MIKYTVLVVGAGPAGSTAALALSQFGIDCCLVDQADFPRDKVCGDALSGKVSSVLRHLLKTDHSLDELLSLQKGIVSGGICFFAPSGQSLAIPFASKTTQGVAGMVMPRLEFDSWLFEQSKKAEHVSTFTGIRISQYEKVEDGWLASDAEGKYRFRCNMLLIADGAQSRFIRTVLNHQQNPVHTCAGLRVYYNKVKGLNEQGFIELHFLKKILPGYLWIFPLGGGRANVGIGLRSDLISRNKLNLRQVLTDTLQTHPALRERFTEAVPEEEIKGYPLPLGSQSRKRCGDNYMLLGDAGGLIDPFTGEGIGNAMISGREAAKAIHSFLSANGPGKTACFHPVEYEKAIERILGPELRLSRKMQELARYSWLFNFVVRKANKNQALRETISCMFEDIDLREKLKSPAFYWKLLIN